MDLRTWTYMNKIKFPKLDVQLERLKKVYILIEDIPMCLKYITYKLNIYTTVRLYRIIIK